MHSPTRIMDENSAKKELTVSRVFAPTHFFLKLYGLVARDPKNFEVDFDANDPDSPVINRRRNYAFLILIFIWIEWFRIFLSLIGDNDMFVEYFGDDYDEMEHLLYEIVVLTPCAQATIAAHLFYWEESSTQWLGQFTSLWHETKYRVVYSENISCDVVTKSKPKIYLYAFSYIVGSTVITSILQYQFLRGLDYYQILGNLFYIAWIFYCSGITACATVYFTLTCNAITTKFKEVYVDLETLRDEDEKGTHFTGIFSALMKLQEKTVKLCEMLQACNRFWNRYLFSTFIAFIPFTVFALYQIVLGQHKFFLDFNFVWYGGQSFLALSFLAVTASKVNLMAHKSATIVHELSLNDSLTIDQLVQIRYFIQRLTGNTLGFTCLGLFTISQSKIYSIVTLVTSFVFLIIDMNRGSIAPKTCPTFTNETLIALFKPKEDEILLSETME